MEELGLVITTPNNSGYSCCRSFDEVAELTHLGRSLRRGTVGS